MTNELHELVDRVQGVVVHLVILLAAWAVYILMLLTHQILHNPFHFWGEIPLRPIPFERYHMSCKLFHIHLFLEVGSFFVFKINPLLRLHLNQFSLMDAELVLKNFVNDFIFRDLVEIVFI
jgi:hypothetical protein